MRGRGGIAGNPVLIGAATTLVVIVAVFLSYNANQGLPFVPTYQLKVEAPSGANLVRGNDVRIGGARVGAIDEITVRRKPDGTNVALLSMKLEKSVSPLPKDSTVLVRPRSALGLKYIEISRGRSREGYQDGDTIPLGASRPPQVEFDEVINTFDEPTRTASQGNLEGFGDAFAGRGVSLNTAIGELKPLLEDVIPVARNLSDRRTNLRGFVRALADTAQEVAPVAAQQADLFVNLDRTFAALRAVAPSIQESISRGPETLDAAIESFPIQRPFLANTEGFFRELRPGARALRTAAPDLASAFAVGKVTLRRSVALNQRLEPLLRSLQDFANDPLVPRGVRRLTELVRVLNPTLQFLAPAQTVCNYAALWFRNIASHLSEGDTNGTWQRFNIIATPQGPNNEGTPSSAPADGPTAENHLHANPYPNTAAPGQPRECESGNEPFAAGQTVIGNTPGTQQARTESTR